MPVWYVISNCFYLHYPTTPQPKTPNTNDDNAPSIATMAELPTPHSLAIATLISLHADPHSPLMSCGDDDDVYNVQQPRQQRQPPPPLTTGDSARGGRAADGGQAGFRMRLERLLMELVLREDEGMVVVLPTPSTTRQNDGLFENPAEDRDDNYKTAPPPNRHSNSKGMDEDDFFAKHALDGGGDVLNDILGLFGGSLPCFDDDEMNIDLFHKTQHQHKQQHSSNSSEMMNNNNHSTSLSFQMESLSTLLDRIDHAFSPSTSSNSTNTYRQQQQRRSPPSTHLLNTLTNHSTSINSVIDLLDNWHSLLSGEYYSPNNNNTTNSLCSCLFRMRFDLRRSVQKVFHSTCFMPMRCHGKTFCILRIS